MDKQKINCTVETCKFNNLNNQECLLKQITVTPTVPFSNKVLVDKEEILEIISELRLKLPEELKH